MWKYSIPKAQGSLMAPGEVVMEGQHPHPRGHGHNLLSVTHPIRILNSERWAESIDQLRWLLEAIAWVRQLGTSGQHSTELYTIDSYKETWIIWTMARGLMWTHVCGFGEPCTPGRSTIKSLNLSILQHLQDI